MSKNVEKIPYQERIKIAFVYLLSRMNVVHVVCIELTSTKTCNTVIREKQYN